MVEFGERHCEGCLLTYVLAGKACDGVGVLCNANAAHVVEVISNALSMGAISYGI